MNGRDRPQAWVGRAARVGVLVLGTVMGGACAPRVDARFAGVAEAASALYVAGHYAEAGERWLAAAQAASSPIDRDEAMYRAATSFAQAGATDRAEALLSALATGHGERAARASFDRARLVTKSDPARGQALRLEALRHHPSSGVAAEALRDYLAGIEAERGAPAALEQCRALAGELWTTELDEAVRYACARRAEESGETERARDDYLETAERHPYPRGAYWDDALVGAARCEERLGHATRAVELLERLLVERERPPESAATSAARTPRHASTSRSSIATRSATGRAPAASFVACSTSTRRADCATTHCSRRRASPGARTTRRAPARRCCSSLASCRIRASTAARA